MQNIMLKTQNLLIAKLEILLFSFFGVIPILIRSHLYLVTLRALRTSLKRAEPGTLMDAALSRYGGIVHI